MIPAMAKVIVNADLCKGCGLCTTGCPLKIMRLSTEEMNRKGFFIAYVAEPERCTGCAMCATMCPDVAITVEK